jgi:prophage antirepressor-like protein
MEEMQIFNSKEFGYIRTTTINNEPWFVGKDVAKALGYGEGKSLNNAILNHVSEEDKGVTELVTPGGKQKMTIINESGLYSLIFGSKLDSAKRFKRWVTSEVLPSIRRTGSYGIPLTIPEQIQLLARGNVELERRIDTIQSDVEAIKADLPILPIEAERITTATKKKGVEVLGGINSSAYRNKGLRQKLYSNLYSNLKYNFGVRSYKSIKRSQCDKAIDIINSYQPPYFLEEEIRNANAQQVMAL